MREAGDCQCKSVTYLEDPRNIPKFIYDKLLKLFPKEFKNTNTAF